MIDRNVYYFNSFAFKITPPVLIIGEVAPGLPAKDVEKAVAWRIERYVAATTGVDHVESLSRNNFALIYVWLKWGTDLSAAQRDLAEKSANFTEQHPAVHEATQRLRRAYTKVDVGSANPGWVASSS